MDINSNLILSEEEIKKLGSSVEEVQQNLTLPNPAYQASLRFGKSKYGRFYSKIPKELVYLKQTGTGKYILPRYYFGNVHSKHLGREMSADMTSDFNFRDYQSEFITEHIADVENNTGILFEASCGSGKTIMAIFMAIYKKRQTLVLVPTYYLAHQWETSIKKFTNASVCTLSAKDTEIPIDRDFTIMVYDLFTVRELPKELIKNIGTVCLDEVHRVGADTYIPILNQIPAENRIGLTATFRRADNVHKILRYHFGEHLKMESRFPKPSVYVINTGVAIKHILSKNKPCDEFLKLLDYLGIGYVETKSAVVPDPSYNPDDASRLIEDLRKKNKINSTSYKKIRGSIARSNDMPYATIDSYLSENSKRTKLIISLIKKCLAAGRTILFLSKRKSVLKSLYNYFLKIGERPMLIVSETNSRSKEEDDFLQNECRLVFGVTQLAKEGLDIDRLDTLIIHLPMKDTEQAIGRISRLHPKKKSPMAFYLLDKCPMTYAVYHNAEKFLQINAVVKGSVTLSEVTNLPDF